MHFRTESSPHASVVRSETELERCQTVSLHAVAVPEKAFPLEVGDVIRFPPSVPHSQNLGQAPFFPQRPIYPTPPLTPHGDMTTWLHA